MDIRTSKPSRGKEAPAPAGILPDLHQAAMRLLVRSFYELKPLIPGRLQLAMRRWRVRRQLRHSRDFWPIDPASATEPRDWPGWPGGKQFALVLTHDVEWANGQSKCQAVAHMEQEEGFRSAFYFVPRRYDDDPRLRAQLAAMGFEIGVHGLYHDGKLYRSHRTFSERAVRINEYLRHWEACGFRSPSMHHNLHWLHELDVAYDASMFDTDPFEPMPDGAGTIFPFVVAHPQTGHTYVELPYTLPQDYTTFVLLQETSPKIWQDKLDWVAARGGMAMVITHPDYMDFGAGGLGERSYRASLYRQFLQYVRSRHEGQYWHALPREVAQYVHADSTHGPPASMREARAERGSAA